MIDLGVVAGEASGDLLGAHFIDALKHDHPSLHAAGIAGPRMIETGVEAVYPSEKLAVNGYVEVLRHLPELLWIRSRITRYFLQARPRVFVGIDAPDFNFALEGRLRKAGIPTVHFVSPSIWAWRPERIHRIKQAVSHMLVVFPFEEQIYRDAGIPVGRNPSLLAHRPPPLLHEARAVLLLFEGVCRVVILREVLIDKAPDRGAELGLFGRISEFNVLPLQTV